MVSRRYNSFKYVYTADSGEDFIRTQRQYKNANTQQVLIPLTATFLSRVINNRNVVQKFAENERHALVTIPVTDTDSGVGEFKQFIP
ncbi:MAG: hypothetical protein ACRDEA_22835, partial [Microcystaceae cyanobacterium]